MNDIHPSDLLDRLDRTSVAPAPLVEVVAAGRSARRRRRAALLTGTAAVVVVATGGAVVAGWGSAGTESTPPAGPPSGTGPALTAGEVLKAEAIARWVVAEHGATVTSATAVARTGTTGATNTGHPCTSGRELHLLLIGRFPHTVVSGPVVPTGQPAPDSTVRAMAITADAASGVACLIGVQTGAQGSIDPLPDSTGLTVTRPAGQAVAVPIFYVDRAGELVARQAKVYSANLLLGALSIAGTPPNDTTDPALDAAFPAAAFDSVSFDGVGAQGSFGVGLTDPAFLEAPRGMTAAQARTAARAVVCTLQGVGRSPAEVVFYLGRHPVDRLFGQPVLPEPDCPA